MAGIGKRAAFFAALLLAVSATLPATLGGLLLVGYVAAAVLVVPAAVVEVTCMMPLPETRAESRAFGKPSQAAFCEADLSGAGTTGERPSSASSSAKAPRRPFSASKNRSAATCLPQAARTSCTPASS